MAEQNAAVTPAPPPGVVMRAVNPLMRMVLGTPLAGGLGKQFMVLTFTGRKSGRQFSIPVTAHWLDGDLYALIGAAWKLNFRGGGSASVLYDGSTRAMRGELIEDPAAVAELFLRCASGYGVKRAQRMMGLKFRDDRMPTLAEFRQAVEVNKLAAIRFTAA
ncbi:hypothetical protein ORI20_25155 [Mycobacterium sp. CVI_P3]|uniref:Deazaflavin-dependent nitroreductase n=1 Tax=Mycobacterium pinniadriaticum TaxID=2994102 RepID=A0ABT3SK82_9MYCO|nr:hypothetical protein [Mycobacterium pinniadriaticum]MCX2933567.1 hypothetical protein [Mycobacterium pinniadriaticum]MCX2939932.1 hypothetical protein [Mycobacterium pinniadriaticum]